MKAIIPTGGRGTRMQPLTFSTNKHFIPIANKPLIYYPIESVADAGIQEVLITYNPGWLDIVREQLGDGRRWGMKFTYVLQKAPNGLADIVRSCEKELDGKPFFLHLGDNIFTDGIKELVEYFEKEKPNGLLPMVEHPENKRLGVPYFDQKGRLKKYVEKPKDPPHNFAVPGLYFSDNNFFKAFKGKNAVKPSERGEWEIPDPFDWMVRHGLRVDVLEYKGKWLDPGKFNDWIESNRFLLDNKLEAEIQIDPKENVKLEGRIRIGKGSEIENSEVRGPVSIGENVKIRDSYIGPYTSVDDNCTIEYSHVENSVLMKDVVIRNIKQPIDESLIGTGAEVVDENGPTDWIKLFIGEKSRVRI